MPERRNDHLRNRQKQREARRKRLQEELIGKRNVYGYKDLTPYNAARRMRSKKKAELALA